MPARTAGGPIEPTHVNQQYQVVFRAGSRNCCKRPWTYVIAMQRARSAIMVWRWLGAGWTTNSPTPSSLKSNAANERLAQHLWNHRDQLLTFLRVPGVDATNWRAELAIRFGVILRKVWGGNRTWIGARAQSVLMSVWRTCWQQGRSALDFLSQLLRGVLVPPAVPP
jgi:transposase